MKLMFSRDIETSILGSILIDPQYCMPKCLELITAADFYEETHITIYSIMVKLFSENKPIDCISVLHANKELPVSYVSSLSDSTNYTIKNITNYVKELKELSLQRQAMYRIGLLKQNLEAGAVVAEEIDKFVQDISDLKIKDKGGVVKVGKLVKGVYDKINLGTGRGVLTGYDNLDFQMRGMKGLVIIAADTKIGKTTFALNIAERMSKNGKNILFFSLEMGREEITERLLAITAATDIKSSLLELESDRHRMGDEADIIIGNIKKQRLEGVCKLSDYGIWIDDRTNTTAKMSAVARSLKFDIERQGMFLDAIMVDYLQFIPSTLKDQREIVVGSMADDLKRLSKELGIPVILLSQVNKDSHKEKRKYRATDLRESARPAHTADNVMFLFNNPEDMNDYTLSCVANRHGMLYDNYFRFKRDIITFEEVENGVDKRPAF